MAKNPLGIDAVPGEYGGVEFRSQLEIGWARWLDDMGVAWLYEEPVPGVMGYLPDFKMWFGNEDVYLEIKPSGWNGWPELPTAWAVKALAVARKGKTMLMVFGNPHHREGEAFGWTPEGPEEMTIAEVRDVIVARALRG